MFQSSKLKQKVLLVLQFLAICTREEFLKYTILGGYTKVPVIAIHGHVKNIRKIEVERFKYFLTVSNYQMMRYADSRRNK